MPDPKDHCFAIPAYGESPYLEDCLQSLLAQQVRTRVVIATSTLNRHILELAERYGVPVHANTHKGGIGSDWNFAMQVADAPWVTLAHQDDTYSSKFAGRTLEMLSLHPSAVLSFSGYGEIENGRPREPSALLRIKQALLELGFLGKSHATSRFSKINALRFGCAIPCPSVTINTATGLQFRNDLKVDLDWAAWLQLAHGPGSFVYVRERLMMHRVHPESETSAAINAGDRLTEDEAVLKTLWPDLIARAIVASYKLAYQSNRVHFD